MAKRNKRSKKHAKKHAKKPNKEQRKSEESGLSLVALAVGTGVLLVAILLLIFW